jgi:translation initiation factor IF-2
LTCRSLINLKEKRRILPNKPGALVQLVRQTKIKGKVAPKPGTPRPPGVPNPNKISNTGGGYNANRSARPGFVKGNRPAIVAK